MKRVHKHQFATCTHPPSMQNFHRRVTTGNLNSPLAALKCIICEVRFSGGKVLVSLVSVLYLAFVSPVMSDCQVVRFQSNTRLLFSVMPFCPWFYLATLTTFRGLWFSRISFSSSRHPTCCLKRGISKSMFETSLHLYP